MAALMNLEDKKLLARYLLSRNDPMSIEPDKISLAETALRMQSRCATEFDFNYPDQLKPTPSSLNQVPDKSDPLPNSDIVVITWTADEVDALADIFTCPYHIPVRSMRTKNDWYEYDRNFQSKFKNQIRKGAPSRGTSDNVDMLGSYFPCKIGDKKVLCFKSQLHLNQDGIKTGDGTATLPVKDLFKQIIEETNAKYILTTGTCGGTFLDHDLGDVVVTKSGKFRLADEFKNEPFNHKIYQSNWDISTSYFHFAESFMEANMQKIQEPDMLPPTIKYLYNGAPIHTRQNKPNIYLEDLNLPATCPILTTDYFEFGNSTTNNLQDEGCGVEMGDAALGLACSELGNQAPKWAVVRNLSDPVINGNLREDAARRDNPRVALQTLWAVWYYETYGYWTTINSALATWSVIAGI
jgi:nucleoside phosphorylase